jgi:L-threonylcarbamoyladenylate synthase
VLEGLEGKIGYILDGGECSVGLESTIVGFENNKIVLHRLGGVSAEQLASATGMQVLIQLAHASPTAPGQLKSHYATQKPLLLGDLKLNYELNKEKKIGLLLFKTNPGIEATTEIILSSKGDLSEAASQLFSAMRNLDASNIDIILAEKFPEIGIGMAINDRLERAAFKGSQE